MIPKNCTKSCHSSSGLQVWGIVDFSGQTDDTKSSMMAKLQDSPDIEYAGGSNWCLVCEKRGGTDNSLASCIEGTLHVAVAGKAWPLSNKGKEDAQLVADLYVLHRNSFINECDGQFAAVIIDEKNSLAVLTVNWPGGFHRLYYCTDGLSLCFATRLDLLVHRCGWRAKVNEQAVVDLLRFGGLASEKSLLEGVYRVVPGFAVVFEKGRIAKHLAYKFPSCEDLDPLDTAEMKRLHLEAVQKRISGYNDFGVFLSGGLDSSMNVATAAKLSSEPIKTFSAAFEADEFDESKDARLVATMYNTRHFELWIDTAGRLDRLPEMIWAMQEPISDYSYIPTFYIAETLKQHVDVAIAGDGSEEFLGQHYQYAAWYDLLYRIPSAHSVATWLVKVSEDKGKARHGFWRYARRKRLGRQLWQSLACVSDPCGSGMLNSYCNVVWGDLPPSDLVRLLSPDLLRRTSVVAYNHKWVERCQQHQVFNTQNNFILADASLAGLCGHFAKVGAMCSAHNVIIHEPYLATPLLRYFYGLESSWKVNGDWLKRIRRAIPTSETKLILRRAATECLPDEIVIQKQKHGFGFPLVQCWQQSTSGVGAQQIFGALLNNTDWFDRKYLSKLVDEQASGVRNHRYILLLLAALDQWFRIFIQGDAKLPTWRWSETF